MRKKKLPKWNYKPNSINSGTYYLEGGRGGGRREGGLGELGEQGQEEKEGTSLEIFIRMQEREPETIVTASHTYRHAYQNVISSGNIKFWHLIMTSHTYHSGMFWELCYGSRILHFVQVISTCQKKWSTGTVHHVSIHLSIGLCHW